MLSGERMLLTLSSRPKHLSLHKRSRGSKVFKRAVSFPIASVFFSQYRRKGGLGVVALVLPRLGKVLVLGFRFSYPGWWIHR